MYASVKLDALFKNFGFLKWEDKQESRDPRRRVAGKLRHHEEAHRMLNPLVNIIRKCSTSFLI